MSSLSLSRLPSFVQLVGFVVLSLGGAFTYYSFIDAAARDRIAERMRELATARARLDRGVLVARRLPEVQHEVANLQARLDSLGRILSEEKDAADLLRTVHTLAAQSNVTILGFRPQATTTRQQHAEWPIGLELEGTYHNFGAFLDRVSKYPRIINVTEVVIRGKQQAHPDLTVDITCTVTTFVLPGRNASAAVTAEQPRSVERPASWANFVYSSDGRRDPFVRLVNPSTDTGTREPEGPRPEGVAGLTR